LGCRPLAVVLRASGRRLPQRRRISADCRMKQGRPGESSWHGCGHPRLMPTGTVGGVFRGGQQGCPILAAPASMMMVAEPQL